ncbi:unnamed protein product, partial [Ilex paraguariensis]
MPLYDDWVLIFGKDRATSEFAQGLEEMIEDNSAVGDVPGVANVEAHPIGRTDDVTHSQSVTQGREGVNVTPQTRKTKKKKSSDISDLMATSLSQICRVFGDYVVSSENQLASIAHRVGYEQDASTSKRAILAELSKIDGLTMAHRHEAAYKIASDNIKLTFSLACPWKSKHSG